MQNATAVMQNLLYDKPLFDWTKEPSNIKILTLGAGVYAQKFIDLCLEVGQIPGYNLEVTVLSKNSDAVKTYEKDRPALEDFVNINGSLDHFDGEKYGVLNFEQADFIENNFEHNKEIVENYLLNGYRYIFVALGNDELNEKIAKYIADTLRILKVDLNVDKFLVNFATTKDFQNTDDSDINAVIINKDVDVTSSIFELDRMAFNTHLVWNNALNADIEKIRKEYDSDEYSKLSLWRLCQTRIS